MHNKQEAKIKRTRIVILSDSKYISFCFITFEFYISFEKTQFNGTLSLITFIVSDLINWKILLSQYSFDSII